MCIIIRYNETSYNRDLNQFREQPYGPHTPRVPSQSPIHRVKPHQNCFRYITKLYLSSYRQLRKLSLRTSK
uniref:Uncharacterized protein n=1 Tax=Arundo donax TaxID=35708 RepID=A0A0A9FG34_ARUDO